jgi:hypothetical protein
LLLTFTSSPTAAGSALMGVGRRGRDHLARLDRIRGLTSVHRRQSTVVHIFRDSDYLLSLLCRIGIGIGTGIGTRIRRTIQTSQVGRSSLSSIKSLRGRRQDLGLRLSHNGSWFNER